MSLSFLLFLMHRVELKAGTQASQHPIQKRQFLMHRVELKRSIKFSILREGHIVPNAPCGVERGLPFDIRKFASLVPNAPCGVESNLDSPDKFCLTAFLMHRVKLKVKDNTFLLCFFNFVSNAPCGVESLRFLGNSLLQNPKRFLMHRVELKDLQKSKRYL